MRTAPPPGSKRVRDWIGKRVRLVRAIANGWGEYPAGTAATVDDALSGLGLKGEGCPHCGVRMFIRRVDPADVEVIPPEEPEPETDDRAFDIAMSALHHIDTMYPGMWNGVPKSARLSLRNHIWNHVKAICKP